MAASRRSRSASLAAAATEACAPDHSAERIIVLARLASLAQQFRVDRAEHRAVRGVRHRDLDLHEARNMDDDPVERLVFPDERDELSFVKGPHLVEPTGPSRLLRLRGPGVGAWR